MNASARTASLGAALEVRRAARERARRLEDRVGLVGADRGGEPSPYRTIYAVVLRIPRGRVATYGQVARLAGFPSHARLAGYALHALPARSDVPWHRVVNAKGEVSLRRDGSDHDRLQRLMLEREKVRFDPKGRIALAKFRWSPGALA